MYTLILVNNHPWLNDKPSSRIFLTREWIKGNHVVYVNPPVTLWQWIKSLIEKFSKRQRKHCPWDSCDPHLHVFNFYQLLPINWIPHGRFYLWLSRCMNKIGGYFLQRFLIKKGLTQNKTVQINAYWPCFVPEVKRDLLVYYSTDLMTDGYMLKHAAKMEPEFISKADLVINTGMKLKKRNALFNPNSYLVSNGVDLTYFKTHEKKESEQPAGLKAIPGPRIIFSGNDQYQPRLDDKLISYISRVRPDYQYIFIGRFHPELLKLFRQLKNIHCLGAVAVDEVSQYLRCCNAGMIPYQLNDLTAHIYPLKIHEYLACGLPVVTTNFSEDLEGFENVVLKASSFDDFVSQLDFAISNDDAEKRIQRSAFSESHGWDSKAKEFISILESKLK